MNCACDFNEIYPEIECENSFFRLEGIFILQDCIKETQSHLETINAFDRKDISNIDEKDLILIQKLKMNYYLN